MDGAQHPSVRAASWLPAAVKGAVQPFRVRLTGWRISFPRAEGCTQAIRHAAGTDGFANEGIEGGADVGLVIRHQTEGGVMGMDAIGVFEVLHERSIGSGAAIVGHRKLLSVGGCG